jgi:hypothetical protein
MKVLRRLVGVGQFEEQLFGSVGRGFQSLPRPLAAKFQVAPHSATRCKAHNILAAAKTERALEFEIRLLNDNRSIHI